MSVQACAEIVRRGDPDRFLAVMAAPIAARAVLFPLYAFNLEVARAPWVTAEPLIAEMRLQWWRDALGEIAAGGIVRRHEVVLPLAHVLDAEGARTLDRLIAARHADIAGPVFGDTETLWAYLDETAGNLMWAGARVLGALDCEVVVRAVARAAGLARMLQALPALVEANRAPMPGEDDISAWAERALAEWPDKPVARYLPMPARAALFEAWQARPLLRLAQSAPGRVRAGVLRQSEFARRSGLIRAAWIAL